MTTKRREDHSVDPLYMKARFLSLRNVIEKYRNKVITNVNFSNNVLVKENHNAESEEDDDGDDDDENGGDGEGGEDDVSIPDGDGKKGDNKGKDGDKAASGGSSIHYVDACTLWKFPIWLVDRLDCSKVIENAENVHSQEIRQLIMYQLKATSTDLIMYSTVRREFLRTILVIELNNIARLLEVCKSIEIPNDIKSRFFSSLKPCVSILEDENKPYKQDFVALANAMDELYVSLTPNLSFREGSAYHYNNIYCSYLVPGYVMQFTEMCCGGIVDNTWFSLESRYNAMVMVTPHVFDDPKGIQIGVLKSEKYRVEAYFDIDHGHYTAFDDHFKSIVSLSHRGSISLEHLVFSYFSKTEHFVEEKNVFLMNGPETKGNLTFAKIYHSLVKTALL